MFKFYFGGFVYDAEPDPNDPFHSVIIRHPIYNDRIRSIKRDAGRLFDDSISNLDSMATEEDIVQMVRSISSFEGREGGRKAQHVHMRELQERIQKRR